MSLEENQEVKPTSRSHLAALVKRGQAAARGDDHGGHDDNTGPLKGSEKVDGNLTRMTPSPPSSLLLGKKKSRPSRPSAAAEREMIRANRAGSNYDPTDVSDSYNPTAEFTDNVMREAFDRMSKGELKDYDAKKEGPQSIRKSSRSERKDMAAKFQKMRTPGHKDRKLKDLRKP